MELITHHPFIILANHIKIYSSPNIIVWFICNISLLLYFVCLAWQNYEVGKYLCSILLRSMHEINENQNGEKVKTKNDRNKSNCGNFEVNRHHTSNKNSSNWSHWPQTMEVKISKLTQTSIRIKTLPNPKLSNLPFSILHILTHKWSFISNLLWTNFS